jgi:RHS repeat-associated protein
MTVRRSDGTGFRYTYSSLNATKTPGYLPDDVAEQYCTSACGPAASCENVAVCDRAPGSCLDVMTHFGASGSTADVCANTLMSDATWRLQRDAQGRYLNPFREFGAPLLSAGLSACATPACQSAVVYERWHGSTTQNTEDFCNDRCVAAAECGNDMTTHCKAIARRRVPFCTGTCYADCRALYQAKDAAGQAFFAYGHPEDLQHNLAEVHELPTNRLVQHNDYGTDPADPSFDKVVTQVLGGDALDLTDGNRITFYYVDLVRDTASKVRPLSSISAFIELVSTVPTATMTLSRALAAVALGAPSATRDVALAGSVVKSVVDPLARFVESLDAFQSVHVCPDYCVKKAPTLTVPEIPRVPPPVVHLPPGPAVNPVRAPLISPAPIVVVTPIKPGRVTMRMAPAVSAAGADVAVREMAFMSAAPGQPIEMQTRSGSLQLTATDRVGEFDVHGNQRVVTELTANPAKLEVMALTATKLTAITPAPPLTLALPPADAITLGPKDECILWSYLAPQVSPSAAEPQLPTHAVVIADLHGVARTEYFDSQRRLVRDVNHHNADGRGPERLDYNYDAATGALRGVGRPSGERSCQMVNLLGNPVQVTDIPAPGSPGDAQPRVVSYLWEGSATAPRSDLEKITVDPRGVPSVAKYARDGYGRVKSIVEQTDSQRERTTSFDYDSAPAVGPRAMTLPSGAVTQLSDWEATGPRTITIDAAGPSPVTRRVVYDPLGRAAEWFRAAHVASTRQQLAPDGIPAVVEVKSPSGTWQRTVFEQYNAYRKPARLVTPTSTTVFDFDALGHMRWMVESANKNDLPSRATCWNYSADGRLRGVVHPEGNLNLYGYDDAGRLVRIDEGYPAQLPPWVDRCVDQLRAAGLATPAVGSKTADMRTTETRQYDARGHLERVTDGGGVTKLFVNDGFGRAIEIIDGLGNRLRRGYDARGAVTWEALYGPNAAPYGKPVGLVPGLIAMVEYDYDLVGRITRQHRWHFADEKAVDPAKLRVTTAFTYDDANATVSVSEDGRAPTVTKYDGAGRVVSRTLPDNTVATAAWQELIPVGDRVTWTYMTVDGKTRTRSEVYDDAMRLLRVEDETGRVVASKEYNDHWQVRRRTIGSSLVTEVDYDSYGRLGSVAEVAGASSRRLAYGYDSNDRLASVRDANGGTTRYAYDGLGRLSRTTHPDANLTTLQTFVDGSMRPHDVTDAFGTRRTFGYDGNGRVTSEHIEGGVGFKYRVVDRTFTYTAAAQLETATISGIGYPTNGLVVGRAYDSLGNRTLETSTLAPVDVAQVWDPSRGPVVTTLRDRKSPSTQATIFRSFDARGRLESVSLNNRPVAAFRREPDAGKIVFGNGTVVASPTLDVQGRVVGFDVTAGQARAASIHDLLGADGIVRQRQRQFNGGPVLTDVYQLDGAGRVTGENLRLDGIGSVAMLPNREQLIASDSQLAPLFTEAVYRGAGYHKYALDGAGNWLSHTTATESQTPTFTSLPGWNQYDTFGRDGDGNVDARWGYVAGHVSQVGTDRYEYDALAQLVGATVAGRAFSFGYDALGRRVSEFDHRDGSANTLVWDGVNVVGFGSGATASLTVAVGTGGLDQHLALVSALGTGAMTYLHQAADGSVFAATSDAGLVEGYAYSAFGEPTLFDGTGAVRSANSGSLDSTVGNRWLFQGQLYDPGLRSYSMRAREYRPDVGRFLSPDPLGIAGGENVYAFVLGKALHLSDPFGLAPIRSNYDSSGAWARLKRIEVEPFPLTRKFHELHASSVDPGLSLWDQNLAGFKAGWVLPGMLVEEFGRGVLNTPYAILAGAQTMVDGAKNLSQVRSWENRVEYGSQIVTGMSQGVLAAGIVGGLAPTTANGLASLADDLAKVAGTFRSEVPHLLASEVGAVGLASGGEGSVAPTYLYRGVHAGHPQIEAARRGVAVPGNVNGAVSAEAHNLGGVSADSPYTSWTHELSVAQQHAAKQGPGGVVLRAPVGPPPPGASWVWEWSPDVYAEGEVLLCGPRDGLGVLR